MAVDARQSWQSRWCPQGVRVVAGLALAAAMVVGAAPVGAEWPVGEHVLEDVVAVRVLGREVVALDGRGGGARKLRLEPGESLIWSGARGRIGAVLTDRRLLGVRSGGGWRVERTRVKETLPLRVELGERVALLATSKRLLAFDGSWRESALGPGEALETLRVGSRTAVVVTDRRALAVAPNSRGFLATPIHLHERVEFVSAAAGLAEVTTSRRVLLFSGLPGVWTETRRSLY